MGTICSQFRKSRKLFCSVIQGLTSALDGEEWSTSRPECFNTVWTLRKREKSFPMPGIEQLFLRCPARGLATPKVPGQEAKSVSK
jgi:hypothetical protein